MLLVMQMHKHQSKACGIRPAHLGDLDRHGLIRSRELDMEGETGSCGERLLAHNMATFIGQTGNQPAPGNGLTRKRERHFDFIAGTIATLHMCLSKDE